MISYSYLFPPSAPKQILVSSTCPLICSLTVFTLFSFGFSRQFPPALLDYLGITSPLNIRPNQLNLFPFIFPVMFVTLKLPLIRSFLILSNLAIPHIHLGVYVSATLIPNTRIHTPLLTYERFYKISPTPLMVIFCYKAQHSLDQIYSYIFHEIP